MRHKDDALDAVRLDLRLDRLHRHPPLHARPGEHERPAGHEHAVGPLDVEATLELVERGGEAPVGA